MNTQGNKQVTIELGKGLICDVDNYLHSFLILLNGESATITSTLPYLSALTEPMLLPQSITL